MASDYAALIGATLYSLRFKRQELSLLSDPVDRPLQRHIAQTCAEPVEAGLGARVIVTYRSGLILISSEIGLGYCNPRPLQQESPGQADPILNGRQRRFGFNWRRDDTLEASRRGEWPINHRSP